MNVVYVRGIVEGSRMSTFFCAGRVFGAVLIDRFSLYRCWLGDVPSRLEWRGYLMRRQMWIDVVHTLSAG